MSEMIQSFGVRWNNRAQGVQKKHMFEDAVKFSLLAAAGFGLKLSLPKIAVLTTLVAGHQASNYAISSASSFDNRDKFLDSTLKASFLYGAFLLGVGAGTTYRGLAAIREAVALYDLNGVAAGLHRLFWTASITFPLSKLLIKLPFICMRQKEGFDRADAYFKKAYGKFGQLRTIFTTDFENITPESIQEPAEGAALLVHGLQSLVNINEKRDFEQDCVLAPMESFAIINDTFNAVTSRLSSEPTQDENNPNAEMLAENAQAGQMLAGMTTWIKNKQTALSQIAYTPERIGHLSLDQINVLLKQYPSLDRNALVSNNEAYQAHIIQKLDELFTAVTNLNRLTITCTNYESLSNDDLKLDNQLNYQRVQTVLHGLTREMIKTQSLLQELGETKKIEKKFTLFNVQSKVDELPVFNLAEVEAMKLRLQIKLNSINDKNSANQRTQENPEDDFTECLGGGWHSADYQKLAKSLNVDLGKLSDKLDELKLNTRKDLLDKNILLTVEEAKKFSTSELLKAEQERRLYKFLGGSGISFSSNLLQKTLFISMQILAMGAAATFAPRCFVAGMVFAVLQGKVSRALMRNTPPNERPSAIYGQAVTFYTQMPRGLQIGVLSLMTHGAYWTDKIPGLYFISSIGAGANFAEEAAKIGNEAYLWTKEKFHVQR